MSFPDFSQIKFIPHGKSSQGPPSGEKTDLYKFFEAIVNQHSLEVDSNQMNEIFLNDLAIDAKKHDKILMGVLAEALIYFMTLWPGWEKSNDYYTGKIQCRDWYEKFRNYLLLKSTHIINNASKYQKRDKTKCRNAETQVDLLERNGDKRIAPYVLCLGGPPSVLNNVVFVETEGNIFIKQHSEKAWPEIEMKELINWPYIKSELELPDISISRTNTHQMSRFLALSSDTTVFPEVYPIKHVKKLPDKEDKELKPYSFEFFSVYFTQLKETLKLIAGVHPERLLELDTILREFLLDIGEADIHNKTMCPYVSVAFHIGKCKYIRNKKVSGGTGKSASSEGINFYEVVIPELEFSLNHFNVEQDESDDQHTTFVSLNKLKWDIQDFSKDDEIKKLAQHINNSSVKYSCTLCNENFTGETAYSKLNNHFQNLHKCEQTLLCYKCRKPFEVQYLTSRRWYHKCT